MDQHHSASHQQSNLTFDYEQFLDALPIPPGVRTAGRGHLLWHRLLAVMAAVLVLALAGVAWF